MDYKYFKEHELVCSHCGEYNPNPEFHELMLIADEIREEYGKPLKVNSGYRCKNHPVERRKAEPGQHTIAALDFNVYYGDANKLLEIIFKHPEIKGIGVNQKGDLEDRFIHIDTRDYQTMWSY